MKELRHLLVLLAVIIAICLAGRCDYNQEVIYGMSEGTYAALKVQYSSESDLVDAYMENREYWDSVGMNYVGE